MVLRREKIRSKVERIDGIVVLRLLDDKYHSDSMDALDARFRALEADAPRGLIVVDLDRVTLLSSSALRAVRAAHARLEAREGRIAAAGGGDLVRGVLKFAPFIAQYATVEEAVSALSADHGSQRGPI